MRKFYAGVREDGIPVIWLDLAWTFYAFPTKRERDEWVKDVSGSVAVLRKNVESVLGKDFTVNPNTHECEVGYPYPTVLVD